jgi:hypothetical protein
MDEWTRSNSLIELSLLVKALAEDPRILDVVLVHVPPASLLGPLRALVDAYDTSGGHSGGVQLAKPLEPCGRAPQTASPPNALAPSPCTSSSSSGDTRCRIFALPKVPLVEGCQLAHDLPYSLGNDRGFCYTWLAGSPSANPYGILSSDDKQAVNGWLAALYGDSGVSDELMRCVSLAKPSVIEMSAVTAAQTRVPCSAWRPPSSSSRSLPVALASLTKRP